MRDFFFPNTDHQPFSEQIFHTVRYLMAGIAGFVCEEPIAELWVITMRVEHRVCDMGLVELISGDRLFEPPVILLATQTKNPARCRPRSLTT